MNEYRHNCQNITGLIIKHSNRIIHENSEKLSHIKMWLANFVDTILLRTDIWAQNLFFKLSTYSSVSKVKYQEQVQWCLTSVLYVKSSKSKEKVANFVISKLNNICHLFPVREIKLIIKFYNKFYRWIPWPQYVLVTEQPLSCATFWMNFPRSR